MAHLLYDLAELPRQFRVFVVLLEIDFLIKVLSVVLIITKHAT